MSVDRPVGVREGFERMPARGPFIAVNGPIWRRTGESGVLPLFGLLPEERHTNGLGFMHGGMIATFLDSAMAQAIFEKFGTRLVTLEFSVTFLHVVMKGRWCEAQVTLGAPIENRITAQVDMVSRGQVCAQGRGIFQLFP